MSRAAQTLGPKKRLKPHSVHLALGKLGAVACHDANAILCTLIKNQRHKQTFTLSGSPPWFAWGLAHFLSVLRVFQSIGP